MEKNYKTQYEEKLSRPLLSFKLLTNMNLVDFLIVIFRFINLSLVQSYFSAEFTGTIYGNGLS